MVIWISSPFDNLPEEGARPQRYALLAGELARGGHETVWWTSGFSHVRKAPRAVPSPEWTNADGVRMRLLPTPPYPRNLCMARVRSHRAYASAWKRAAEADVAAGRLPPPDLVLASLPPLATAATARSFRERWGCRVVTDIMDAWPETFCELLPLPRRLASLAGAVLFAPAWRAARRAVREADGVSAVGDSYLAWARRLGATAPGTVCYHGIALPPPAPPRARGPGDPFRIAYAGNMGRSYDLRTLVEAVSGLDGVRLDLAGTGPDEARLRRHAAKAGDAIRFHGQLDAAGLDALLAGADAGAVPIFDRSMVAVPYKLADYAAAGLAILETLRGETRALVEGFGAGLWYPAGDVAACRAAILRLASRPGEAAACRAGARRLAGERFDAAKIYPAFRAWLERFAAPGGPR